MERPLVSIGMPVYNAEEYIGRSIDSVLNQTYSNLELIISDNASTDSTQEICKKYLKMDSRISYYRLEKNFGAAINFNSTFNLSNGEYFKWQAHDDIMANSYLSKCLNILKNDRQIVLCHTFDQVIDEVGKRKKVLSFQNINFNEKLVYQNYLKFLKNFRYGQDEATVVNGLFRTDVLALTNLIGNYNSSDLVLLAQIVLCGKIEIINECLFFKRYHKNKSTQANRTNKEIAKWFDTSSKGNQIPLIIWFTKFLQAVGSNREMTINQKVICYLSTIRWFFYRIFKGLRRRLKVM